MTAPKDISRNLLPLRSTLREVLERLNAGVQGVILMVDEEGRLRGLFTDGDTRRALLGGAALDAGAEALMNKRFTVGSAKASRQENLKLLTEKIRHLPILDLEGRPVDLISWAELWRLPVMEPSLGGNELKYVSDCIASNWISSQGKYVTSFEESFQKYTGSDHALCVSSGTAALHLALAALEIGGGDEVIMPDLTFAATANVVIHRGGVPVLADVTRETWTLDPEDMERKITGRTRAIMPVHLYGHPCDMEPILDVAARYGLKVIEDCAESFGAKYKGRQTGTMGDVGCFSFFANKVITTGEGGMVTTADAELHRKMTILRDHGMSKEKRYWHLYPGYNYRMTNMQAAIGLAQMERIGDFLEHRARVVALYNERLGQLRGILLPPCAEWAYNIFWLYSIVIDEAEAGIERDELAAKLAERGIETRPFFYPVHVQPPYLEYAKGKFPVTDWLSARGLSLPTANDIRLEDVERVCGAVEEIVSHRRVVSVHLQGAAARA
ncbi:MAG: aminotransferase class I/II-fold pyridoxal phosphate-dependent enzyme [Chthoniobacteraceae bacterium]